MAKIETKFNKEHLTILPLKPLVDPTWCAFQHGLLPLLNIDGDHNDDYDEDYDDENDNDDEYDADNDGCGTAVESNTQCSCPANAFEYKFGNMH
jgi:hypothetical protein